MITTQKLDAIEQAYSEDMGFEPVLMKYKIKEIAQFCKGESMLDLGCGIGQQTKALAPFFNEIVGIDGSSNKLNKANHYNAAENICYEHTLFEDYKPGRKFDFIISTNVLEHVDNSVCFLKQAKSLLSEEGQIVMTVPNALGLHKRIGFEIGLINDYYQLTSEDIGKGHKRIYDQQLLRRDFEEAGLQVSYLGGILLKPLSHKQMEDWNLDVVEALYVIGKKLPEYCSSLIIVAKH